MGWLSRRTVGLSLVCLAVLPAAAARAEVLGGAVSVALGSGPVRIALGQGPAVAARTRGLPAGRRIFLVLRDLRAAAAPGVLYNVFLGLDAGAPLPAGSDPRAVGVINFYSAVAPGDAPLTVSFDITGSLRSLAAGNALRNELAVTIAPADRPAADAGAVLGAVELVME